MANENEDLREKLIIALDFSSFNKAMETVDQLDDYIKWYKVGMELFYAAGSKIVEALVQKDKKVFLDLKYHDIPNTVAKTAKLLVGSGVSMFNIHISGGKAMIHSTLESVYDEAERQGIAPPKVLGVTALTSLDQWEFNNILGISGSIKESVIKWTELADKMGMHGVVASPKEAFYLKGLTNQNFLIVTPGIRPKSTAIDDQKRVNTPEEALQSGATHLVVGRPITACHTVAERKSVLEDIFSGMRSVKNY